MGMGSDVVAIAHQRIDMPGSAGAISEKRRNGFWRIVSPPDAKWKAPYSARFHFGASAPGG